ncbi:hypothetical protein [Halorientalis salina]|uniref:hypothetical protein n=1 Tax=Halorientalis salina TaxID=2932266 RepID=UPI0010AD5038|nr:hypothetical protein [Halorientalis salina]
MEYSSAEILRGVQEKHLLDDGVSVEDVANRTHNYFNQRGELQIPVLDEKRAAEEGRPEYPNGKEFAVCLTHDVDHICPQALKPQIRQLRTTVSNLVDNEARSSLVKSCLRQLYAFSRAAMSSGESASETVSGIDAIRDVERKYNAPSTFFVPPEHSLVESRLDPHISYSTCIEYDGETRPFTEVMKELLKEGVEIGLHPSLGTYRDSSALRTQRERLETVIGSSIESVRHHRLQYDIQSTPSVQAQAGFKYDSSLGIKGDNGFRFGTSYPWKLYDWTDTDTSDVLEIPLVLDEGFLKPGRGGISDATYMSYVDHFIREVKAVSGTLTLLWHPSFFDDGGRVALYESVLERLAEAGAWFTTIGQLGAWWNENVQSPS